MPIVRNGIYEMEVPKDQRHTTFLASYDLELNLDGICLKIGRFSAGVIGLVKLLVRRDDKLVLDVGCFCEASKNVKILVGGNHQNDNLFNINFGANKVFAELMDEADRDLCEVAPSAKVCIGDNVTLSHGVTVAPGARIGSGSIIGAGAVVTKTLDPLGVYAGVPAKLVRPRFDAERASLYGRFPFNNVAAHSVAILPTTMMKLQNGEIDGLSELDFIPERPIVEMTLARRPDSDFGIKPKTITGYRVGERRITNPAALSTLNNYFGQIASDAQKVKWTPDIFDNLGLYS